MSARTGLLLVGLLALTGCSATSPPLIDRLSPGRVHGDADHVSIQGGRFDALPLAVAHCARYGRSAQYAREDDGRSIYACVTSP